MYNSRRGLGVKAGMYSQVQQQSEHMHPTSATRPDSLQHGTLQAHCVSPPRAGQAGSTTPFYILPSYSVLTPVPQGLALGSQLSNKHSPTCWFQTRPLPREGNPVMET